MATSTSVRVDWRGQRVAAQLLAALEEAMEETAAAAEQTARSLVGVDTGEMRDGLHADVERQGDVVTLTLTGDAPHTIHNEYGTSTMPAQPMIRPAMDQQMPRLPGRIRARVGAIR